MEEAAERMAALKKVYSDIILNMGKESAARILASHRRALRSEQGLFVAKDEALAALLRLKSIMDAKIRVAETTSLGQLRKIEELEGQLNEAEDIICSLRTELEGVNSELAKIKNSISEPLSGQITDSHETTHIDKCQERNHSPDSVLCSLVVSEHTTSSDNNTASSQRNSEGHPDSLEHGKQAESTKHLSDENGSVSKSNLASMIMRSREPELYRNGCTQRIRALEQNLLTAKTPLGQSDDHPLDLKSESPCSTDFVMAEENVIRSKYPEYEEMVEHACSFKNGQAIRLPRTKRKYNHVKLTNSSTFPDQDMVDHEPSDTVSYRRPEDVTICSEISDRQGSPGLLQCSKMLTSGQNTTRKCHSETEDQASHSPPFGTENTRCGNSVRYPSLTDTKGDLLTGPSDSEKNVGNAPQEQAPILMTPDQNVDISGISIISSDIKDEKSCVSRGSAQAGKFLKYTFQRKRKRGSSNNKEDNSLLVEKSTSMMPEDKQNASQESLKPSLVMELPRKDRRLVQVARQLISLSERKW